jgi:hypothetical protein
LTSFLPGHPTGFNFDSRNLDETDFSQSINFNFNFYKQAGSSEGIKLPVITDRDDLGPSRNYGDYILDVDFSKTTGQLKIFQD